MTVNSGTRRMRRHSWTNVTRHLTGLPAGGTITSIAPSSFDPARPYVSVDLHLVDNRDPFIFKTTDFGSTWKRISGNLPKHELSYVRSITDDPNCAGSAVCRVRETACITRWMTAATGRRCNRVARLRR